MSTEKRDWSKVRSWNTEEHAKQVQEAQQLEALMRSILKLFADGCLVYRNRERRTQPVSTQSTRLKRIRADLVSAADGGSPALA